MTFTLTYNSLVAAIQDYLEEDNPHFVDRIPQFIYNAEIRISREIKELPSKVLAISTFTKSSALYQKPNRWRQTISVNYANSTPYLTESRVNVAGTRTLTVSTAQPFVTGDNISVWNVGGSGYNGDFTVTAYTQYTVSYVNGSSTETLTADTGGFITAPVENFTNLRLRSYEYCRDFWPDLTQTDYPLYYADVDLDNIMIVPTPLAALPWQFVYYETPDHLSDTNQQNWMSQYVPDLLLYGSLLETAPYLKNDPRLQTWKDLYDRAAQAASMETQARTEDAQTKRTIGT